jgi:hypothetical protein
VQGEQPRHRVILEQLIAGYTPKEVAANLNCGRELVRNTFRQTWANDYMIERIQKTAGQEIREMLEKAAPQAVGRVIELAENAKGTKLGLDADLQILERYLGKAAQPVTVEPKDFDKLSDAELEKIALRGLTGTK